MILWNVLVIEKGEWKTIATIRFDYYSESHCKNFIRNNHPEIMGKVTGKSWTVEVAEWK